MGILKEFTDEIIVPALSEFKDLIHEANDGLKELGEDFRALSIEEKKEVFRKFPEEMSDLREMVSRDIQEMKGDFDEMIQEVTTSDRFIEEASETEKRAILQLIQIFNPIRYEERVIDFIQDPKKFVLFDVIKYIQRK